MGVNLISDKLRNQQQKKCEFFKEDVVGKIHIVSSNGIYIDTLNLMPRIQN